MPSVTRPPEAVGAALLVSRFDVSVERAASLAARPVDEVETVRE